MRIAKPLLLVTTPIGVVGGLWQAFQFGGGLAFIMLAMVVMMGVAVGSLVLVVRRENAEAAERQRAAAGRGERDPA